ncbi:MAG: hypothetical protein HOP36_04565 [Methyloglobulus sp.]|nr:hypothetical protein [Methyloglobulus sp.]
MQSLYYPKSFLDAVYIVQPEFPPILDRGKQSGRTIYGYVPTQSSPFYGNRIGFQEQ